MKAMAKPANTLTPTNIRLLRVSRILEVSFDDGTVFRLPCEYLRVHSPSAEVQGHGPGQEVLQIGKEAVNIAAIEPVGAYAVRLIFDDGHQSGIYSWPLLYKLGVMREQYWQEYLRRLKAAGYTRKEPPPPE
jgi:DUF971 family protein